MLDRSIRSFFAVFLLVFALMVLTNLIISAESVVSSGGLLGFGALAIALAIFGTLWLEGRGGAETENVGAELGLQLPQRLQVQEWSVKREESEALLRPLAEPPAPLTPDPVVPMSPQEVILREETAQTDAPKVDLPEVSIEDIEQPDVAEQAAKYLTQAPIIQDAKQGDVMAQQLVGEAMAAQPASIEIDEQVEESIREIAPDQRSEQVDVIAPLVSSDYVDPLEQIDGIGPKYRDALYAAGIKTFRQLEQATGESLTEILRNTGIKLIPRSVMTWPKQASFLAREDNEGFTAYINTLKGGRSAEEVDVETKHSDHDEN
ncbi:MAG: hypothetical protein MUF87_14370 [Anaerolineae bacterium]|jgi:predicted flap endonuclease-1-like 5' DNA nuclease|nr:hypothetical protein [Anaerolineae bacterium]